MLKYWTLILRHGYNFPIRGVLKYVKTGNGILELGICYNLQYKKHNKMFKIKVSEIDM